MSTPVHIPSVLVVYPGPLLSLGGGPERARAMCRALKEAGIVLHLVSRDRDLTGLNRLDLFDRTHLFTYEPGIRFKRKEQSFLIRNIDIEFDIFARSIADRIAPTAVLCHFAWTASILKGLPPHILGILDTIDIQHLRAENAMNNGSTSFDRKASKTEELHMLSKANIVVAIQSNEEAILKSLMPHKQVICSGHSIPHLPLYSSDNSKAILFVASNYEPNNLGISQFITKVWPSILQQHPDASLDICGSVASALGKLTKTPRLNLHGQVTNLIPFYTNAAIVINVALFGTGLPVKTAEAIAHGKCLVCTSPNARGFHLNSFPGTICTLDNMATHINHFLQHPEERHKKELAATQYSKIEMIPNKVYRLIIDAIFSHAATQSIKNNKPLLAHGFLFLVQNYPLILVLKYYTGLLLSRIFWTVPRPPSLRANNQNILPNYLKMRWNLQIGRASCRERV